MTDVRSPWVLYQDGSEASVSGTMDLATGGGPRVSVDSLVGTGLTTSCSRSCSLAEDCCEWRREGLGPSWLEARLESLREKRDLEDFSFAFCLVLGSLADCICSWAWIVLASEGVDERESFVAVRANGRAWLRQNGEEKSESRVAR